MIAPARQAAFDALQAMEISGVDLPAAIDTARRRVHETRDQALLTEIVTGVVRHRSALDYQIGLRLSRPVDRLDAEVRTALRLGAFQLLHLTRIPDAAVVDDAVALTKRAKKTSAGGMVNAVLRRLAREKDALAWPETPLATALAIRYSHPEWLVARWLARVGEESTRAWLHANNQPPRLCLAVNLRRGTRDELAARLLAEGIVTEPTDRAPHGLHVSSGAVLATDAWRDGWFVVQDEASQLVHGLGTVAPQARVLDLCAAPGGKTVGLAARLGEGGVIVACDVRPRRVRLLRSTLLRMRMEDISVVQVDGGGALPFRPGAFDFVLVDAPCSGLGTVRRDPDIRWKRGEEDLARLAAAQRLLLGRAAGTVAAGGTLVYATCSSEPEENDEVARAFLAEHADFRLVHEHRTLPFRDGLDAFYAAVITRNV